MSVQKLGHNASQADHLRKATFRTSLECDGAIETVGGILVELAENLHSGSEHQYPDLVGHAETLRRSGTLVTQDIKQIERASEDFRKGIVEIEENIGDITSHRPNGLTLKSYIKNRKNGLAPHRDSNFGGDASLVGMVSILGSRKSALWAVPQAIILPGSDREMMERSTRDNCLVKMRGFIGGKQIEVTPFEVATQTVGDATFIDERPKHGGTWKDPKYAGYGEFAIWHSVFAEFIEQPETPEDKYVFSLITRNRHASAAINRQPPANN